MSEYSPEEVSKIKMLKEIIRKSDFMLSKGVRTYSEFQEGERARDALHRINIAKLRREAEREWEARDK